MCGQSVRRGRLSRQKPRQRSHRVRGEKFQQSRPVQSDCFLSLRERFRLGFLDTVEVVMAIEEEFAIEIPDAEADKILSIEEASEYISSNPDAK